MRALLLLLTLLSSLFHPRVSAAVAAAAATANNVTSAPLWAAVSDRFAEATDATVRAALPDPLPPPLLLPDNLPAPKAERWAEAPQATQQRLQDGLLRAQERDYGAAIKAFTAILNQDARTPLAAEAAYQRAAAEVARVTTLTPDRPQPAIDAAVLAVALHPDHPAAPLALFTLAHLYDAIGDTAAALAYLRRAASDFPHYPLAPRIRYQELRLLEREGAWLDAFRLAEEISTAYPDEWVTTLARLVYLDHAIAAGDTAKMVADYQLLQEEALDWSRLTRYRYDLFRAAMARGADDLARPLLISLRQDLSGEAAAALLIAWGDSHLLRGDQPTALTAYSRVQVEHGRTAMADLARLRNIQLLYPTTPQLGHLRLTAPLRALIRQNGRPRLQQLANNVLLGLLVDSERWEDALSRLDRRPVAEPDLRQQGWYEPLYGDLFSRVWTGRLSDRPTDLLELFQTFIRQQHDVDTLTPAMVRQVAEVLADQGYREGAATLMAHLTAHPDAGTESHLRRVELLIAAADEAARSQWDDLVARHDPATLSPPLRLRLAAAGLTLGEVEQSATWAATALADDPSLTAAQPMATYRLATYDLAVDRAAAAEPLLRAIAEAPGAVGVWRAATALAETLFRLDHEAEAAKLLRDALASAPSKEEEAWARTAIALAIDSPATPLDGAPPHWANAAATVDRYRSWEKTEARPLAAFRTELTAVGIPESGTAQ